MEHAISLVDQVCLNLSSNPQTGVTFRGFCQSYSEEDVDRLKDKLIDFAEWACGFDLERNGPDMDMASDLCSRAVTLLDRYSSFNDDQRAIIVGAIRYLVFRMDAVPDKNGSLGLEDDKIVMNSVLTCLGLHDLIIPDRPATLDTPPGNTNKTQTALPGVELPKLLLERKAKWSKFRKGDKS